MPAKKKTKKVAKKTASKKKVVKKASQSAQSGKKTVKKTTKKAVNKVVQKSAKRPVKKSIKKKATTCKTKCHTTEAFWVNNGPVVHSVEELLDAIRTMSDEQYAYHTTRDGNDFANWIKDCLKDGGCATSVKRAKSRSGVVRVLSSKCSC